MKNDICPADIKANVRQYIRKRTSYGNICHPLFSSNPPSKSWGPVKSFHHLPPLTPSFQEIWSVQPPSRRGWGGVHTICFYFTLLYSCSLFVWQNDFLSLWKFNIYIHISCLTMFYLFFISNYNLLLQQNCHEIAKQLGHLAL